MIFQYQKIELSEWQLNWLRELQGGSRDSRRKNFIKFRDEIAKGFDPNSIDYRLHNYDRRTLVGEWYVDPNSPLFDYVDRTIKSLYNVVIKNQDSGFLFISDISKDAELDDEVISNAQQYLTELDLRLHCLDHKDGNCVKFRFPDEKELETLFKYTDIHEAIERNFTKSNKVEPTKSSTNDNAGVSEEVANSAFIIMAMDSKYPELEDVCETYKEVCKSFGITARRVDEIEHQGKITDLILSEIRKCEFLIGDLSYERPNVYYEIGYAHAIGKRPILYRKQDTKIHFDLSVHNVPGYSNLTELKKKLHDRFEAILGHQATGEVHDVVEEEIA